MQAKNILQADFLDILFENRNQLYGAYTLRKNYNKRLMASLGIMTALCSLFYASTLFAGGADKNAALQFNEIIIETEAIPPKEDAIPEPPAPLPTPPAELEDVSTVRSTTLTIVEDSKVNPENEVPPVETIETAIISNVNHLGTATDPGLVAPPVATGPGTGSGSIKGTGMEVLNDGPVVTVSIQARFPGGTDAWRRFLEKNLNRDEPVANGAAPGSKLTVIVSFVVDRDGNVSDVKAENDPGYGTAAEAVRVIKRGPQWMPAEQNGRKVIYRQRQSITFMVDEE
ncbi:energy transducer TonB [Filimonas effusa]|nr:energy transducer TonB [Filimonas effusa]